MSGTVCLHLIEFSQTAQMDWSKLRDGRVHCGGQVSQYLQLKNGRLNLHVHVFHCHIAFGMQVGCIDLLQESLH